MREVRDRSVSGSDGLGLVWGRLVKVRSGALNKLSHQGIQENPARNCAPYVQSLPS